MKCRYCKKNFEQNDSNYCPNCGREIDLKRKQTWHYYLVFSIIFIELLLIILPLRNIYNIGKKYENYELRETKFLEKIKELNCEVIDVTETEPNSNVLAYYVTDTKTCPYLISYTKFSSKELQINFYNQLRTEADNVNGYRSYTNVNFTNYKEYNLTGENEYRSALYNNDITIYIQGNKADKEVLTNLKKELGFDFKLNRHFDIYLILLIIIINIMTIVTWWLLNVKMGREGWICLIPIYNIVCLCEDVLGKKSYAWIFLIPYANFIFAIILLVNIAKVFGKNDLYQILTVFFSSITIPLIAFDNSTYTHPNKNSNSKNNNNEHYVITNDNHIESKTQTIIEKESTKKENIFLIIIKWILTFCSLFMALGSYALIVEEKEYENILPGIIFFILAIMACPAITEHTKKFKLYTKYKSVIVFILIVLIIFIYGTI